MLASACIVVMVMDMVMVMAQSGSVCGDEDAAAGTACTTTYNACVQDALANRDKYSNTCHCFSGYVSCSVGIACIQASKQHEGFLAQCRQFCPPCNNNATATAVLTSPSSTVAPASAPAPTTTTVNSATSSTAPNGDTATPAAAANAIATQSLSFAVFAFVQML
jgi:hypothetical protein